MKKGVWHSIAVLLLGMGLVAPLLADDIPGLYEAEIPVTTQEKAERGEAVRTALQEVLVRVTGRQFVLTVTPIEEALATPTRFVQQFRYRTVKTENAEQQSEQVLWVRFDQRAIDALLHDNRLPVWGRTRPATLVWLVVDNRKTRTLLNTNSEHQVRNIMEQQAKKRGLPLRLPLFDLTDRANISISDVWGNFEDTILQASERYQTEAVMVGRVFQTYSGNWSVRWTLYSEGRRQDWSTTSEVLAEVVIPGMDLVADTLGLRFAQVQEEGGSDKLLVKIQDVESLSAYNRALKYLQSLSPVTQVQPHTVNANSVIFDITSRTGRLAVSRAISLGHTLVELANMSTQAKQGNPATVVDLHYRLVP